MPTSPPLAHFAKALLSPLRATSRAKTKRTFIIGGARFVLPESHLQALAALTVIAALLRFWKLGTQSYWYDEAVTVGIVRRPLLHMLAAIPHSESTPPLYYVLAWGWSRLFGLREVGLRSLSAVFGTATIPAAYAAARGFVPRRSSLLAAALIAVSPFLVWYSQEARAYAMLVFFGALSLAFLQRAGDLGSRSSLVGWVIVSSLALATHYFAFFLVAAEAALLRYRCAERRAAAMAVATVALVAAALVPLALYQARYSEHTAWISTTDLGGRVAYLLHQLVVGVYPVSDIRPIVVAVPVIVIVGSFVWTERSERAGAVLALMLGIFAVAAPLILAVVGDHFFGGRGDYFIYRNLIVAVVPLTIAAAAVAGTPRIRKAGLVVSVLACVLLIGVSIDISRRQDLQKPDIRAVAAALDSRTPSRAILADVHTSLVLRLYDPQLKRLTERGAYLRRVDVIEESGSGTAPRAGLSPPPGFRRVESRHVVQGFTIVRLQSLSPRLLTRARLAREFPSGRNIAILLDSATT